MRCLFFSKDNLWSNTLFAHLNKDKPKINWVRCMHTSDYKKFNEDNVDWAFFFHWSYLVPKEIYDNNRCVVLHTSNLPNCRGGSPLQHQIINNIYFSHVNAIHMSDRVDGGPVYCSKKVSLQGSLTDIWLSIARESRILVSECVENDLIPVPQVAFNKVVKRRRTCEIPIDKIKNLNDLYNYVRMLDAEGYDNSFVKVGPLKIKLSRAKIIDNRNILADAIIEMEDDENIKAHAAVTGAEVGFKISEKFMIIREAL